MEKIKVSYIVPVYNVEKYVKACVDSILAQTISDYEVIIINDGSTDSSLDVVNKEYGNNPLVKILSQQNQGLGPTRNNGVAVAKGEYIQYVDSDDTLEPNMTELLYEEATKSQADIVICAYNNVNTYLNKTFVRSLKDGDLDISNLGDSVLRMSPTEVLNPAWNKLYRREFIKDIKQKPISPGQDIEFNLRLLALNPILAYVNIPLYNFFSRGSSSITHSYRKQMDEAQIIRFAAYKDFFESLPKRKPEYALFLNKKLLFSYMARVKNIYRYGTPYGFSARTKYLKEGIMSNEEAKLFLKEAGSSNNTERFFLYLYKTGNPWLMNVCFTLVYFLQRKLVKRA